MVFAVAQPPAAATIHCQFIQQRGQADRPLWQSPSPGAQRTASRRPAPAAGSAVTGRAVDRGYRRAQWASAVVSPRRAAAAAALAPAAHPALPTCGCEDLLARRWPPPTESLLPPPPLDFSRMAGSPGSIAGATVWSAAACGGAHRCAAGRGSRPSGGSLPACGQAQAAVQRRARR